MEAVRLECEERVSQENLRSAFFRGPRAWVVRRLLHRSFAPKSEAADDNVEISSPVLETGYFSRATTNSGAQSSARLISESGKKQIDLQADSAYCAARDVATSNDP